MPSWNYNMLSVIGKVEDLKEFAKTLNTPNYLGDVVEFDFSQTIPPPEDIYMGEWNEKTQCYAMPYPHPPNNILDWTRDNWGVKWGASNTDVENHDEVEAILNGTCMFDESEIRIAFSTPWGPPVDWVEKVAKKYPKLHFECAWNLPDEAYGLVTAEGDELEDFGRRVTDKDIKEDEDGFTEPCGMYLQFMNEYGV